MALVCRIDVSDCYVEIIPVKNNESEWNAYSVNAQRDGMTSTRHQTRWYSLFLAALCEKSTASLAPQSETTDVDTLLTKLEWASCNLASFLVEFRPQGSSPNAPPTVINYDTASSPVRPVQPKTNHPIAISVIARHLSESQGSARLGRQEGVDERYGHFVCKVSVDPAEVYNSPIGRLEYRFQLYNQDVTQSHSNSLLPGTPRFVGFTVTAHRGLPLLRLVRNFHDFCILLDKFVLDVTRSTRKGLLYSFGFFSDVSSGVKRSELTHYAKAFVPIPPGDDGVSRILAVPPSSSTSPTNAEGDEGNRVNVSHAIIVSSQSTAFSTAAVGERYVAVSRFKTDPTTGLCKTSLKATLALVLLCRDPTRPLDEATMEVADVRQRIDLAQEVLNQEVFPASGVTRTVSFAYGEEISFRLTRRCFESPNHYGTPVLIAPAPSTSSEGAVSSTLLSTTATADGTRGADSLKVAAVEKPVDNQ